VPAPPQLGNHGQRAALSAPHIASQRKHWRHLPTRIWILGTSDSGVLPDIRVSDIGFLPISEFQYPISGTRYRYDPDIGAQVLRYRSRCQGAPISGFRATVSDIPSPISGTISGPISDVPITGHGDSDIGYNIGYNIGSPDVGRTRGHRDVPGEPLAGRARPHRSLNIG
jgi:hypothetical protein